MPTLPPLADHQIHLLRIMRGGTRGDQITAAATDSDWAASLLDRVDGTLITDDLDRLSSLGLVELVTDEDRRLWRATPAADAILIANPL